MNRLSFVMVLAFALSACERRGNWIERKGSVVSPGGNWKVELLEHAPGLRINRLKKADGVLAVSVSPADWSNHPNAFVFIDDEDRVWAFNGVDRNFIYESMRGEGGRAWDFASWKGKIPDVVAHRVPVNVLAVEKACCP